MAGNSQQQGEQQGPGQGSGRGGCGTAPPPPASRQGRQQDGELVSKSKEMAQILRHDPPEGARPEPLGARCSWGGEPSMPPCRTSAPQVSTCPALATPLKGMDGCGFVPLGALTAKMEQPTSGDEVVDIVESDNKGWVPCGWGMCNVRQRTPAPSRFGVTGMCGVRQHH